MASDELTYSFNIVLNQTSSYVFTGVVSQPVVSTNNVPGWTQLTQ